ncbi:hypothetical protein ACDH53_12660, partial [Pseudomonas tremae]
SNVVDAGGEDLASVIVEQIGLALAHRVDPSGVRSATEGGKPIIRFKDAIGAIERRVAIMSDSWLNDVARETEETRLQGGFFCKRRLTRHDWNDGNNNLADVLLYAVHGLEVRSTQAGKSIARLQQTYQYGW